MYRDTRKKKRKKVRKLGKEVTAREQERERGRHTQSDAREREREREREVANASAKGLRVDIFALRSMTDSLAARKQGEKREEKIR